MIPYGRHTIDDDDVAAVTAALRGDWLTQGPAVAAFEDAVATACEADYAVAFSNGTAALHAAAWAAGVGPGQRLATSPLSFNASAACAVYVGAKPTFVDIEADTLNLDPERVPAGVDALVAVHYAGLPVDLTRLSRRPRVVIEDAAHAIGARTPDGPVGNCARSDMCMFSFHPVKTVTTAEGGAVTTNSSELAERLRRFRHHGIEPRPDIDPWFYEIEEVGYNYRLTDLQAALGTTQLRKLETFIDRRTQLADRYRSALGNLPVELPPPAPTGSVHGYHLFPIRVEHRRAVYEGMRRRGIGVQVHFVPIYRHPMYRRFDVDAAEYPETERAYSQLLSLPLFPRLANDDQDRVVQALVESLAEAG